jgi:hypothetical protein
VKDDTTETSELLKCVASEVLYGKSGETLGDEDSDIHLTKLQLSSFCFMLITLASDQIVLNSGFLMDEFIETT